MKILLVITLLAAASATQQPATQTGTASSGTLTLSQSTNEQPEMKCRDGYRLTPAFSFDVRDSVWTCEKEPAPKPVDQQAIPNAWSSNINVPNGWSIEVAGKGLIDFHSSGDILLAIHGESGNTLSVHRDGSISGELKADQAAQEFWKAMAAAHLESCAKPTK